MIQSRICKFFSTFFLLISVIVISDVVAFSTNSLNDPLVPDQWGWLRIHCDMAYDTGFHGSGVIIAVLDTGVDTTHPDLKDNLISGYNFVDKNDDVTDLDGHGTMVAGIIAAAANNSIGIAGVAPEVKIMPLKVLTSKGGNWIDLDLAIIYAANHGAKIITMSLGGKSSLLFDAATQAAINFAYQQGCVLIAAAGNDNSSEPFYPASYDKVIAVAAIDQNDTKASFSNYGNYIDISAPGVNILSTMINGTYAYGSGTSFATPFVAGVAALLLSKHPNLTPQEVEETLCQYAEDLGESGWDTFYGWGLVNAYSTITQTPIPEFLNVFSLMLIMALSGTWLCIVKKTIYE
ncbi:peptidase S8 [Candidatus Bathyarchaeota archaeon]|nr:peptidase S8 [Candidatus Bathyarchaeota archaeon]